MVDSRNLADRAGNAVGCESFQDEIFDALYEPLLNGRQLASGATVRTAFMQRLRTSPRFGAWTEGERARLAHALTDYYVLLKHAAENESANTGGSYPLARLAALELGDRTSPAKRQLQNELQARKAALSAILAENPSPGACPGEPETPAPSPGPQPSPPRASDPTPSPDPQPSPLPLPSPTPTQPSAGWLDKIEREQVPAVFGAWKTMATAYQSCEAVDRPPLDGSARPVQGIAIIGQHPNGVGKRRIVDDLPALLRTHAYVGPFTAPSAACFDTKQNPLIYDYGGKPWTSNGEDGILDLFRDAGTGTAALGTDCSGFVFSALAAAGLKVKTNGRLKAVAVHGISASMFKAPQENGLDCLIQAPPDAEAPLLPGDLIASQGHVVMVDSVGADPLAIGRLSSLSQCVPENIRPSRFRFTIAQSSPSLDGIGINRMQASTYFTAGVSMTAALIEHAVRSCRARFGQEPPKSPSSAASIVRHDGSNRRCSDRRIRLARESCLDACTIPPILAGHQD